MSSCCKECDSYKEPNFGPKYSAFLAKHQTFCRKNQIASAGEMDVCGMQKIFVRLEQKLNRDSKIFLSLAEKTLMEKGRLTDVVFRKMRTFYGNSTRAIFQSVNEMRQAVWAVWAHTFNTDD
ncbi:hypothetical protein TNCV_1794271 [Trichonephila clavipes]|nr:hypothetical protein TNCV_1794271 [Trichonephila clavipes]